MDGSVARIGDDIRDALELLGVTEDRANFVLSRFGIPCGCCGRRKWLNRVDRALQLGERRQQLKQLMGWK